MMMMMMTAPFTCRFLRFRLHIHRVSKKNIHSYYWL